MDASADGYMQRRRRFIPASLAHETTKPRPRQRPRVFLLDVQDADGTGRAEPLEAERRCTRRGRQRQLECGEALPGSRFTVNEHDYAGRQELGEDHLNGRILFPEELGDGLDVGRETIRGVVRFNRSVQTDRRGHRAVSIAARNSRHRRPVQCVCWQEKSNAPDARIITAAPPGPVVCSSAHGHATNSTR